MLHSMDTMPGVMMHFSINATARKNEEGKALEAIYTEAERAKRFGFTKGELDRAKAKMLSDFENRYKQKDKIDNDTYVSGIQSYFLSGEPLTSMDFDYDFLKKCYWRYHTGRSHCKVQTGNA